MKAFIFSVLFIFGAQSAFAATMPTLYFSCVVKEPVDGSKKTNKVTARFAISGYDQFEGNGSLIEYPGFEASDENEYPDLIIVDPIEIGERVTILSNLTSQGGDLRIEGDHVRLYGDGDGYQYTDLVVFDVGDLYYDDEDFTETLDGYVRDYGSAYGGEETFKQFIKCQVSTKPL